MDIKTDRHIFHNCEHLNARCDGCKVQSCAKVAERLRGRLQSDYYSSSNLDLGLAFLKSEKTHLNVGERSA